MMPAIRVENLGKSYCVNHAEERLPYKTLRDSVTRLAMAPVRRWQAGGHSGVVEKFWALKDVSFDIAPGEVVGIIGRNGAGKSTLLKILSRITMPTTGRATIRGRVGSLLEVGTGFHPELTGRENIYMNGSILGMSRAEIRRKFDEIVEFSGVEKFLDTPVKRYSSGMQVRLAFAVAANLNPEILIIDEVLAVGDAEFQKRCLGKMQDVAASGRTVLFVSHNLAAVRRMCGKVVLLEGGTIKSIGDTGDRIDEYLSDAYGAHRESTFSRHIPPGRHTPYFKTAELRNMKDSQFSFLNLAEPFQVVLTVANPGRSRMPVVLGVAVFDTDGNALFTSHSNDVEEHFIDLPVGESNYTFVCSPNPLMPGRYSIQLGMVDQQWHTIDVVDPDLFISIEHVPHFPTTLSPKRPGRLLISYPWKIHASGMAATHTD